MGAKSGSWSGGKGTSAEVPAVTSSNSGHNGFNMVSVWPPEHSSPVPVGCGGIVGPISERSGYLDYQKKKKKLKYRVQGLMVRSKNYKGIS